MKEKDKAAFFITREIADRYQGEETLYLAELVERLNLLRDEATVKRLFQKNVRELLLENDLITDVQLGRITDTALTAEGEAFGLSLMETKSKGGIPYHLIMFSEEAQKVILQWFTAVDGNPTGD